MHEKAGKTIGIWGANGFIGRHVASAFTEAREDFSDIRLFARHFEGFPVAENKRINRYGFDFSDTEAYLPHLTGCDTAVFLVSASRVGSLSLEDEIALNVHPYQALLKALADEDFPLRHLIYVSSGGAVYGQAPPHPINEDFQTQAISAYGQGKVLIENSFIEASVDAPWNYTILRVANPVGGGQTKGLVKAAVDAACMGEDLCVWGDGSTVRDYFDVSDLANAVVTCARSEKALGKIYNVGSGTGTSINDIIASVQDVTGKTVPVRYEDGRGIDVPYNVLDCSRIEKDMDWRAQIPLKESVRKVWETR